MNHIDFISKNINIPEIGTDLGVCRITGKESKGMNFNKWVKKTFVGWSSLYEGSIISNEAAFCFCEVDESMAKQVGRFYKTEKQYLKKLSSKVEEWRKKKKTTNNPDFSDLGLKQSDSGGWFTPQNFRTYSHIILKDGKWLCLTKADKSKIIKILQDNPKVVSLTDTGKKHIYFLHRMGFWQLDYLYVKPDLELFNEIHSFMMECLRLGYNQNEVKTADFKFRTIKKVGLNKHIEVDEALKKWRGLPMFDFAAWLMYSIK